MDLKEIEMSFNQTKTFSFSFCRLSIHNPNIFQQWRLIVGKTKSFISILCKWNSVEKQKKVKFQLDVSAGWIFQFISIYFLNMQVNASDCFCIFKLLLHTPSVCKNNLEFDFQTQSKLINIFLDVQPREVVWRLCLF